MSRDIKITHNGRDLSRAIDSITDKKLKAIFIRSLKRSLTAGRNTARKALKIKAKPIKGETWTQYFNKKTRMRHQSSGLSSSVYKGELSFTKQKHGLGSYVTKNRLIKHREQMNRYAASTVGGKRKSRVKPARPLIIDLQPGKKTRLKRAFAGRGKGKGALQVFIRRKGRGGRLSRPSGPSLAQLMRSKENKIILATTRKTIQTRYVKEFSSAFDFIKTQIK